MSIQLKVTKINNNWALDTCPCIFEYSWEDHSAPASRVHTPERAIFTCEYHSSLGPGSLKYSTVIAENKTRQALNDIILKNTPEITDQGTDPVSGNTVYTFKPGMGVTYVYTGTAPNRVCNAEITGYDLPSDRVADLQALADDQIGAGLTTITTG
jgi:hypothetical protein